MHEIIKNYMGLMTGGAAEIGYRHGLLDTGGVPVCYNCEMSGKNAGATGKNTH
jgi:hypothetical protein